MRKTRYPEQQTQVKKCQFCGKEISLKTHPKTKGISFVIRKYCNRVCMGKAFSKDRTGVEKGPYKMRFKKNVKYYLSNDGVDLLERLKNKKVDKV